MVICRRSSVAKFSTQVFCATTDGLDVGVDEPKFHPRWWRNVLERFHHRHHKVGDGEHHVTHWFPGKIVGQWLGMFESFWIIWFCNRFLERQYVQHIKCMKPDQPYLPHGICVCKLSSTIQSLVFFVLPIRELHREDLFIHLTNHSQSFLISLHIQ